MPASANATASGELPAGIRAALETAVEDEIAQAVAFAEAGTWEPVEDLLTDVHAERP